MRLTCQPMKTGMPAASQVVLDTHALLWWQASSDRLSANARLGIISADQVVVPSICCWEIAMLVSMGRIELDRPVIDWTHDLFGSPDVVSADITTSIAANAGLLDRFHGDPADRLIVATATKLSLPLLTKDRHMHEFAQQSGSLTTIW